MAGSGAADSLVFPPSATLPVIAYDDKPVLATHLVCDECQPSEVGGQPTAFRRGAGPTSSRANIFGSRMAIPITLNGDSLKRICWRQSNPLCRQILIGGLIVEDLARRRARQGCNSAGSTMGSIVAAYPGILHLDDDTGQPFAHRREWTALCRHQRCRNSRLQALVRKIVAQYRESYMLRGAGLRRCRHDQFLRRTW